MISFPMLARTDGLVLPALRHNRWLMTLVALHSGFVFVITETLDIPFHTGMFQTLLKAFATLLPVCLLALVLWRLGHMICNVKTDRPLKWVANDLRDTIFGGEAPLGGVMTLIAMTLFCNSFTVFKQAIPYLHAYSWDPAFARIDRALHGGIDPYSLLMPYLGHPWVVTFINANYHMWAFVVYFAMFVACFARGNLRARNTFLLAFVLTWGIGGNLLATVFASGGPVYYELMGNGADFAPLMSTLAAFNEISPVWALDLQKDLWQGYVASSNIAGISAMPSMHVASTVVVTLYAFTYARWAGLMMMGFTLVIMVGSVMLGWHYAIDSYAGAILALLAWAVAGRISRLRATVAAGPALENHLPAK